MLDRRQPKTRIGERDRDIKAALPTQELGSEFVPLAVGEVFLGQDAIKLKHPSQGTSFLAGFDSVAHAARPFRAAPQGGGAVERRADHQKPQRHFRSLQGFYRRGCAPR
jgi:hypothetical protein